MKKALYAICFICIAWICFVIGVNYYQSKKILKLDKFNDACRVFDIEKGLHKMQPNCVAERRLGNMVTKIKFNDMGLPSPTVKKEKTPGITRVLFLGGSNMVGLGINEEYYPQKVLTEEFEKELGTKVEIINAAVEGYTTAHHAIMLTTFFDHYRPDVVISYTASGYKIFKDAVNYTYTIKKISGEFGKFKTLKQVMPGWLHPIATLNEPFRKISRTIAENLRYLKLEKELSKLSHDPNKQAELLLQPTVDYLKWIDQYSKEDEGKLFVVIDQNDIVNIYPQRLFDEESLDFIFRFFQEKIIVKPVKFGSMLKDKKIKSIELKVKFTQNDYFKNSIYYNKNGYRKLAHVLAKIMSKSKRRTQFENQN